MYAPVVTRFLTYDVAIDKASAGYCKRIMELPAMKEWIAAAKPSPMKLTSWTRNSEVISRGWRGNGAHRLDVH